MRKRAIIIGASSGIGLAIAKRLAADGWSLGLAARREGVLSEEAKALLEMTETQDEEDSKALLELTKPQDEGESKALLEKARTQKEETKALLEKARTQDEENSKALLEKAKTQDEGESNILRGVSKDIMEKAKAADSLSDDGQRIVVRRIDVVDDAAGRELISLISDLGGVDLYVHAAGIGWQNYDLEEEKEMLTVATNVAGFTRMVGECFRYMSENGGGQIAVISSVAATKGLGAAPAYSSSKSFQARYIEALEQLATIRKLNIRFTDCRPGFVATDLIKGGNGFPLLMQPEGVAAKIVKAIYRKRHVVVIDGRWAVIMFLWRLIPRFLWRRLPLKKN